MTKGAAVHAVDEELGTLLTRERRHLIPTYQRDYEWTEEGQWQLLMDDILDVTNRLLRARAMAEANGQTIAAAEESIGPHFLGAVVLEGLPPKGAHVATCAVIDGQQRLTTIYLLIRGLVDVLIAKGAEERIRQARKLILITRSEVTEDEEVFKLWPRRRDRACWESVMGDEMPVLKHPYVNARKYFADRVSAWVENMDEAGAALHLAGLVDALMHKIKIVVVDLELADDPQLIFEVLNGRQTALSAADLVKNLIFMRAGVSDKELDALYDKYWDPFDDEWWSGSVGRGHASRGRRDQLLATWLTIQTADEVNLGHLYGEARRFLGSSKMQLTELLQDISELAREYRQIYERPDGVPAPIASVYHRMERLGVTTAVPLLAWLRTLPNSRMSAAQHERAVAAIDSFVMRRMLVSAQTRGYGRAFLEVLQEAKTAPDDINVDEAIIGALLKSPLSLDWPLDAEIEHEFLTRSFYGRINQSNIRMILSPIDRYLQTQLLKSEHGTFKYDELTIEHVLPQSWQEHWPVDAVEPVAKAAAEAERERHVNRIGNLTLITKYLNPAISNYAWAEKRPQLKLHSKLALSADIVSNDAWDESEIDARARTLAKAACAVWGRP